MSNVNFISIFGMGLLVIVLVCMFFDGPIVSPEPASQAPEEAVSDEQAGKSGDTLAEDPFAIKIDASSDSAMVESMDYISERLEEEDKARLQNDFVTIMDHVFEDARTKHISDEDASALLLEAINGLTVGELALKAEEVRK